MKIIDEKGKLFKIVNVVDLLVIGALLAAVFAICWTLFAAPLQASLSQTQKMTTVVRIRGASIYMQDEVTNNSLVGKQLIAGTDYIDAYIISVEFDDYENQNFTADGEIATAIDPVKKDIIVTIESEISATTPILKIGTQEVRAGRTMIVKTRDFETSGYIQSVTLNDSDN